MILLITSKSDLTADYLIKRLKERGLPFFRFNTEDLLTQFEVSIKITKETSGFIIYDKVRNVEIESSEIKCAYFRKPTNTFFTQTNLDDKQKRFCNQELNETLRSLWRIIPSDKWLNNPENLMLANNKTKQLLAAKEIGLNIPDTLISSNSERVLDFINKHNSTIIAKAVKHGFLSNNDSVDLIFTNRLNEKDFKKIQDNKTIIPFILQPELEKKCDLRVTIVGKSLFTAALKSQENVATKTDWRTWDTSSNVDLTHLKFDLPESIEKKCLEINSKFALNFSCIDLVLEKNGDYFFLEVNPNGQWAWIEDILNLPIRDAIIDFMIR